VSGGLDSCVLTALLAKKFREVQPVYVRNGLLWESVELHWAKRFLSALAARTVRPLKEIALPLRDVYDSHWSTTGNQVPDYFSDDRDMYLPGRNLILLAKTSLYCALNQLPLVALGPLEGNPFPDSNPAFFTKFQEMARQALTFDLKVITPFSTLSKAEVIRLGKDLPLDLTFSCVRPIRRRHCGACNKCAERRRSFVMAGVTDRTHYHSLPLM
jgi:7-cyano-7-deazaguanine synthase